MVNLLNQNEQTKFGVFSDAIAFTMPCTSLTCKKVKLGQSQFVVPNFFLTCDDHWKRTSQSEVKIS